MPPSPPPLQISSSETNHTCARPRGRNRPYPPPLHRLSWPRLISFTTLLSHHPHLKEMETGPGRRDWDDTDGMPPGCCGQCVSWQPSGESSSQFTAEETEAQREAGNLLWGTSQTCLVTKPARPPNSKSVHPPPACVRKGRGAQTPTSHTHSGRRAPVSHGTQTARPEPAGQRPVRPGATRCRCGRQAGRVGRAARSFPGPGGD